MGGKLRNITVAAVIPLYNGASFIEEAILSVLGQTDPVDEFIIVDDGSTDAGPEIVDRLCKDKPIVFLRKPNGGQGSARNFAVRHTQCTHIAFLDQDDVWYEDHVAILTKPFADPSYRRLAVSYGDLDQIDRSGRMIVHGVLRLVPTSHPKTSLRECLQHDMFMLPSASLVSKQAIEEVGFFDERLIGYEDDDLFVRMFSAGFRFAYTEQLVTKWRIYGDSTSFSPRMAKSRLIYFDKLIEAYPDDPTGEYWARDVTGPRFMRILLQECFNATKNRDAEALKRSWADVERVAPVMNSRIQMRVKSLSSVIPLLGDWGLFGIARSLTRRTMRQHRVRAVTNRAAASARG